MILYISMHFSMNLVKVRKVWLKTNLKWNIIWKEGTRCERIVVMLVCYQVIHKIIYLSISKLKSKVTITTKVSFEWCKKQPTFFHYRGSWIPFFFWVIMDQTQLEEQTTQKLMLPNKYSHIYTSKMNMTISKLPNTTAQPTKP